MFGTKIFKYILQKTKIFWWNLKYGIRSGNLKYTAGETRHLSLDFQLRQNAEEENRLTLQKRDWQTSRCSSRDFSAVEHDVCVFSALNKPSAQRPKYNARRVFSEDFVNGVVLIRNRPNGDPASGIILGSATGSEKIYFLRTFIALLQLFHSWTTSSTNSRYDLMK